MNKTELIEAIAKGAELSKKDVGGAAFSPANDCTRAQIVTFLYRYLAR